MLNGFAVTDRTATTVVVGITAMVVCTLLIACDRSPLCGYSNETLVAPNGSFTVVLPVAMPRPVGSGVSVMDAIGLPAAVTFTVLPTIPTASGHVSCAVSVRSCPRI
jgi:hypothetical protein